MKYAVVVEKAAGNYSAYVPDLPGCIATGATIDETLEQMEEALAFHIEGMQLAGLPIPGPSVSVEYVEVEAIV